MKNFRNSFGGLTIVARHPKIRANRPFCDLGNAIVCTPEKDFLFLEKPLDIAVRRLQVV